MRLSLASVYFLSKTAIEEGKKEKNNIPSWKLLLSGGFAGVLYWLSTFPIDGSAIFLFLNVYKLIFLQTFVLHYIFWG
jgi:hypothetical protein